VCVCVCVWVCVCERQPRRTYRTDGQSQTNYRRHSGPPPHTTSHALLLPPYAIHPCLNAFGRKLGGRWFGPANAAETRRNADDENRHQNNSRPICL